MLMLLLVGRCACHGLKYRLVRETKTRVMKFYCGGTLRPEQEDQEAATDHTSLDEKQSFSCEELHPSSL